MNIAVPGPTKVEELLRRTKARVTPKKLLVAARMKDVAFFQGRADKGQIPSKGVVELATVFAAMRRAQESLGAGHLAMDAVFDALPESYQRSWLAKRR